MSRRVLGAGAAAVLATALAVYGVAGAIRVRAMQAELQAAERDIGALRAQVEKLTVTIHRLRNDPGYIEKLAREEHGFVREGETVLKFPPKPR